MVVKNDSLNSNASMKAEGEGSLLEVVNLTKRFGGLLALESVNFRVGRGEFLGVIGPNGAGKTTLFNVISGVYRPEAGKVVYKGRDISRLKFHEPASLGIVRTFQSNALFPEMTIFESIIVAHQVQTKARWWEVLFDARLARRERSDVEQSAIDILESLGLTPFSQELAKNLPHGHQRQLGVAIALAARPELLMLDEPVTGMTSAEVEAMLDILRRLRDRGITVLLVEHNMGAVMSVCDRVVVLNHGRKIAEGVPEDVAENKDVVEAYLGTVEDAEAS